MKKVAVLLLIAAVFCAGAYAFENDGSPAAMEKARRIEIKKIKDAQRQSRLNQPGGAAKSTEPSFWDKEGKRSGFSQTGENFGHFVSNLNPVPFFSTQMENYKARKAAAKGQSAAKAGK